MSPFSAHLSAHMVVSEPVRLQAKDGTRTRDIHLGKVELYH